MLSKNITDRKVNIIKEKKKMAKNKQNKQNKQNEQIKNIQNSKNNKAPTSEKQNQFKENNNNF